MDRIGKYEILRPITRGPMGHLYVARDPDLGREVAVKVMPADITTDEQARARFYREARAAARLQHRNIITVYEFAHDGDVPYIVMEYLRGENLADRLKNGTPLPLSARLDLVAQLCDGLHFAHGEGVVHRDVKPANIWLLPDGGVKLLDFGIAKPMQATVTDAATIVGSAAYMSPEQIEGQPIDPRSDVFSLGAVLYELVAGRRAFEGASTTSVMLKITEDEPVARITAIAPDTPEPVADIISRALQKAPEDRYPDAASMARDLRITCELIEIEHRREDRQSPVVASPAPATPSVEDSSTTLSAGTPTSAAGETLFLPGSDVHGRVPIGATGAADDPAGSFLLRNPETSAPVNPAVFWSERTRTPAPPRRWGYVAVAGLTVAALAVAAIEFGPQLLSGKDSPRVQIASEPPHARIFLEGTHTGLDTPAVVTIDHVPADVRLELNGYEPVVAQVTREQPEAISATLRPIPPVALSRRVRVESIPAGAALFVAGRDTGQRTPAELEVPTLPAELRLELAGFSPYLLRLRDEQFTADTGVKQVRAVLERPKPADARLRILRAPLRYVGCTAAIGKTWKGRAFDGLTEIKLPPRTYAISVDCGGNPPLDGTLVVPPGTNSLNYSEVVSLP